ncbi:hypothetical protein [Streptomyces sp. NPDC057616]|uniref:hypothetical protein n=1 Tax=Streptomyces sp. NPDC057616 TaxID=3346183 RepID=UPI0036C86CAA
MTDATTGRGAGDAAGRGSTPEHGRGVTQEHDKIVAPTPHEVTDPETPAPGTRSTTDIENETAGRTGTTGRTNLTERENPVGTATESGTGTDTALLSHDECDKLELRLRNAVSGFVDSPKQAVEEADHVVEEIAGRFTEALTRRRRTLRTSWQDGDADKVTHSDTEQLRLALRDYRQLAERLLHSQL